MKKIILFTCAVFISLSGIVGATSLSFTPNDRDMYDLEHGHYYTWGIRLNVPENETIVSASLFFNDIRNWNTSVNDLWVNLLDRAPIGLRSHTDNSSQQVNAFEGQGVLLNQWHNIPAYAQDIAYDLDAQELAALVAFSVDGIFGLGFDPDCHFYNNGIRFTIETQASPSPVPEPGTMVLFGIGIISFACIFRRKKTAMNYCRIK